MYNTKKSRKISVSRDFWLLNPPLGEAREASYCFFALYDSMVFVWMMMAVSPRVSEQLSVVMVRVTLHEVSPNAIVMAEAMANAKYLIAFTRRCF